MKAEDIYRRASINGVTYVANCTGISISKWESLMKNATRANKERVKQLIRPYVDETMLMGYNPYNCYKTKTHLIFVHSSIEYFFKIN